MRASKKVIVKYSPGLDALYLWFVPKQRSRLAPVDSGYFFLHQSQEKQGEVCGYEWLDFSYFVDDNGRADLPISEPDFLFDVQGTDVKGATLKQVIFWAYKRFVGARSKAQSVSKEPELRA